MNEIEKAMLDLQQHIGILDMRLQRDPESCNDDFLSKIDSYSLAIQALEEKAERDKMRCENCMLKDKPLCRAIWKTKYNIKKEKWICKTMMEDDGFCSRFEPKESEDKASE